MKKAAEASGRRGWRIVRRAGLGLVVLLVVLGAFGALYNALAVRYYQHAYPPPGKFYKVNGYTMHLYCTGEGSPTLVLDAGLGNNFTVWGKVQPPLSQTTRVCSYDRAGLGWSEAQPGARDSNNIADQLHALLLAAGITEPVVLMGHSFAGLHMRAYASRFPHDVAGMVFVDGSSPFQLQKLPAAALDFPGAFQFLLVKSAVALGIARLSGKCTDVPRGLKAQPYAGWFKADVCRPRQVTAIQREVSEIKQSTIETANTGPYGDLPILIFSHDLQTPLTAGSPLSPDVWREMNIVWNGLQEDLKQLSARSQRIVAKGSGHYIQLDRADLLNREVPRFIQQVRTHTVPPENGTTRTE